MGRSTGNKSRALDLISVGVLLLACLGVLIRFGPVKPRHQATNLMLYALGDAEGCSMSDVWNPLDADLLFERERLLGQIEHRRTDGAIALWDTPFGPFWTPFGNDLLVLLAENAVDVYRLGVQPVRSGDVVIDCGANIGTFSRMALNAGAGRVIAVEPSPLNVEALLRTFAEEIEDGRFVLVPKAVWNAPGEMMLNVYELSVLDSLVMDKRHEAAVKSRVPVALVTIDSIVEELGLSRVDFIKMDIEGAERQALEGAVETLQQFRPRMAIATENLLDDVDAVPAAVLAAVPGYEFQTGRCLNIRDGVLRPEAISFTPPTTNTALRLN